MMKGLTYEPFDSFSFALARLSKSPVRFPEFDRTLFKEKAVLLWRLVGDPSGKKRNRERG
jgi:hypothetical protein